MGGELMKYTVDALAACCRKPGNVDLFVGDTRGVIFHRRQN